MFFRPFLLCNSSTKRTTFLFEKFCLTTNMLVSEYLVSKMASVTMATGGVSITM